MSDENDKLQEWIDPELEARVVAWVLGEASEFEAAELARIVAEKPELGIFKRRIEAVHGLVQAASRGETDPMRLAEDRRRKLLETMGQKDAAIAKVVAMPQGEAKWKLPVSWAAALGIAACLAVLVSLMLPVVNASKNAAKRVAALNQLAENAAATPGQEPAAGGAENFGVAAPALPEQTQHLAALDSLKQLAQQQKQVEDMEGAAPASPNVPGAAADNLNYAATGPAQEAPASAGAPAADNPGPFAGTRNGPMVAAQGGIGGKSADLGLKTDSSGGFFVNHGAKIAALSPPTTASAPVAATEAPVTVSAPENSEDTRGLGIAGSNAYTGATTVTAGNAVITGPEATGGIAASGESEQALADEAKAAEQTGQYDNASQGYDKVLKLDPSNIAARHGQEETYRSRDQYANEAYQEARSEVLAELGRRKTSASDAAGKDVNAAKSDAFSANGIADSSGSAGQVDRTLALNTGTLINSSTLTAQAGRVGGTMSNVAVLGDTPMLGHVFRAPMQPAPVDLGEVSATDQPYSTFSLHVSDVSFQLARAALAQGQMPDSDSIRPEEFYNAFDYGDPAPGPNEQIACHIEQAAHPILQQRNLVRIAMKVAATGRGARQPLRLTVLLDTSGSMEREDRAASVQRAMRVLTSLLGPDDAITLISFARQPRLLAEDVRGDQAGKLVDMVKHTPSEGGTNMEEAIKLASQLAMRHFEKGGQNRVVMLTDGAANLGDARPEQLSKLVEQLRQKGVSFDACGVGASGLDDDMLEALTRKGGGRYYFLNQPEDADAGFARQLAGAFRPAAENVKMQVRFNSARVGNYRLIGFEKHRLKQEDFRNDKVTAAQLAAEEAAVALYQVQVLPEGEGEVGEVFVRFRDPSSGKMVEQSWTIPYDAQAPALDKASPSMQLAATASLLAEKLRGGPIAAAVDLDALAPIVAQIRGHYAGQSRVQDLVTMFEQTRRMTAENKQK